MSRRVTQEQIDEANSLDILEIAQRYGAKLRRSGREYHGPCPVCGGTDRFVITPRKNLFLCRQSQAAGGPINLIKYLLGCDFITAVEELVGRSNNVAPKRVKTRFKSEKLEKQPEIYSVDKLEWILFTAQRDHNWVILMRYLTHRCCCVPISSLFTPKDYPVWEMIGNKPEIAWRGPQMIAQIIDNQGITIGLHFTALDKQFEHFDHVNGSGKAKIKSLVDANQLLPAKKVKGRQKGGHIRLNTCIDPKTMFIGEGIETVLSFGSADDGDTAFWSAVSLGNLAGRADPDDKTKPDVTDLKTCIKIPMSVKDLYLIADGDSDPLFTAQCMARASARFKLDFERRGLTPPVIRILTPPPGMDFNDVARQRAAEQAAKQSEVGYGC